MSMTNRQALNKLLQMLTIYPFGAEEALAIGRALKVLNGPTREMVERMRYPWERIIDAYGNTEGYLCECGHMDNSASNFCRYCGLPKTDEAVEMVVERWEVLHDNCT